MAYPKVKARWLAKEQGLLTYSGGKTCVRGHTGERYVRDGRCVQCVLENNEKRYAENKEDIRIQQSMYNASYRKRPEVKARKQALHVSYIRAECTPSWLTEQQLNEIRQYYIEAERLTRETGVEHHVDHYVPIKSDYVCGLHVPWNLQVITKAENKRKYNHIPKELSWQS